MRNHLAMGWLSVSGSSASWWVAGELCCFPRPRQADWQGVFWEGVFVVGLSSLRADGRADGRKPHWVLSVAVCSLLSERGVGEPGAAALPVESCFVWLRPGSCWWCCGEVTWQPGCCIVARGGKGVRYRGAATGGITPAPGELRLLAAASWGWSSCVNCYLSQNYLWF